jgi:HEPN domain-containing protein
MVDRLVNDEWLAKAEKDFQFAQTVFVEEKEYYDQICLHFHQSAEKFLKAYLIANALGFERTHDLPLLLQKMQSKRRIVPGSQIRLRVSDRILHPHPLSDGLACGDHQRQGPACPGCRPTNT